MKWWFGSRYHRFLAVGTKNREGILAPITVLDTEFVSICTNVVLQIMCFFYSLIRPTCLFFTHFLSIWSVHKWNFCICLKFHITEKSKLPYLIFCLQLSMPVCPNPRGQNFCALFMGKLEHYLLWNFIQCSIHEKVIRELLLGTVIRLVL